MNLGTDGRIGYGEVQFMVAPDGLEKETEKKS
jgi:hypothetical protein